MSELDGWGGVDLAILAPAETPTFAVCEAATDYRSSVRWFDIPAGTRLCVRTSEGNLALVEIVNIDGYPDTMGSVTIDVVVWNR